MGRLNIFLTLILFTASINFSSGSTSLLGFGNFTSFVQALNYPVETHDIQTEDGYILTFFRIQAKGQTSFTQGLPVIYLQHGFIDSGDTWVINEESDAPGLQLANQGYDIWIGNSRGNKYSLSHITLNSNDPEFWQFSWQNMSQYDLPAAFQYINQQTGQQINYIGHSQGTTIMFAALSERDPTILQYLDKFVALSPVAWVTHIKSGPFKLLADSPLATLLVDFHVNEFFPPDFLESEFGHIFCGLFDSICGDFLTAIAGSDPQYDNYEDYSVILEHEPGGTSVMDALHWKQEVVQGSFNKYDYGTEGNMLHYNQPAPPNYNVSNINVPVYLFFGLDDALVSDIDTQTLLDNLTGSPHVEYKEYPAGHMTFLWSKNISFYFNDLLEILESP